MFPMLASYHQSSKYLLALKMAGFNKLNHGVAKYLELHLGYYARGYGERHLNNERNLYFGIGINLAQILKDFSFHKSSKIFNYYQMPYSYIEKNIE